MDRSPKIKRLKSYLVTFVLKFGVLFLNFGTSIVLANALGLPGFGQYAVVMAWVSIASALSRLGTDLSSVRFCSLYIQEKDWSTLLGYVSWALGVVTAISFALICFIVAFVYFVLGWRETDMFYIGITAALIVPPLSLLQASSGMIRGTGSIIIAQLGELSRLSIHLAAVIALFILDVSLNTYSILALMAVASLLSMLMNLYFLYRYLTSTVEGRWATDFSFKKSWWKSSTTFAVVSGMNLLNQRLGLILIGLLSTPEAAGIFTIGRRVTDVMKIVPATAVFVIGPKFARLFSSENQHRVSEIGTKIARATTSVLLIMMLLLLFFGEHVLSIFGSDFTTGQNVLVLFALAHVVSSAFGPVALSLNMSSNEKRTAMGMGIAVVVQAVLCFALIPFFGPEGAALASLFSVIIWNGYLSRTLYSAKKIRVSVL